MREAYLERITKEVNLRVYINLDRPLLKEGILPPNSSEYMEPDVILITSSHAQYGEWFNELPHWIQQIAVHGPLDLRLYGHGVGSAGGDHHMVEDSGLIIGDAIKKAVGDKVGIRRCEKGSWSFEGNLADVTIDMSNRPTHIIEGVIEDNKLKEMTLHFFKSLTDRSGIDLYAELKAKEGYNDPHHKVEALFKAFGVALYKATRYTGGTEIPSSKGVL